MASIHKTALLSLIRAYGANATICALAEALRELGPEWCGDDGPATGIEAVTGYSPFHPQDYRGSRSAPKKGDPFVREDRSVWTVVDREALADGLWHVYILPPQGGQPERVVVQGSP